MNIEHTLRPLHRPENARTEIVLDNHHKQVPCVAVFGVDTAESVDSYTAAELEEIIALLQTAVIGVRAIEYVNHPTLWTIWFQEVMAQLDSAADF